MARNKDGEYDPNETGVRWWQETLHLNKDVSSSKPVSSDEIMKDLDELASKENQAKKPFVSIKDVAKEHKEYEKEVSKLEPFVPVSEAWHENGDKVHSSKTHFSLQNPKVTRKENKYYVDGKELNLDEIKEISRKLRKPVITSVQKPKEDFSSGIYVPSDSPEENKRRYREFVEQTEYNRNNPDRRDDKFYEEEQGYKPYSWQVSQHKYPKGIKLSVDTEQQEIPLWKLDQDPHLLDSRKKYNDILKNKYDHYTDKEWNEVMKKRGFNPPGAPLNPILPIEKGDDGEIKVLNDQEWKEKKKKYEDFQRDNSKLYEEGRTWENARAYAPPTLTEDEWLLNKKKYADYRDKLESEQKKKRWNIPDSNWWQEEPKEWVKEDEWTKEAKFHKDYFERRAREIEENKNYIVEDLKKTKEALRRVINEKNEIQKELIHYLELSNKSTKENNVLRDKLKLLETNPEEYHKRKSLDPYGEENWEN